MSDKQRFFDRVLPKTKRAFFLLPVLLLTSLTGCNAIKKTVTITAIQHQLRGEAGDMGYYFESNDLSVTEFVFDIGSVLQKKI